MGVYELVHRPDVPTGAVISEAVELAQRYSTDDSSRFVNGVLAAIAAEVRPRAAAEVEVSLDPGDGTGDDRAWNPEDDPFDDEGSTWATRGTPNP